MKVLKQYLPLVLFFAVSVVMVAWDVPLTFLQELLSGMNVASYIAYVLILTAAVVFMPLTVMPVIPIAASIMGPLATAVLSVIGWSLGGAIAFLLARYLGRPALERFVDLKKMDSLVDKMPPQTHFWYIILLRLTLPVDLVSYALGLTKSLSFYSYIAATVIGVTWFSFAFAYLGEAFFEGNTLLFMELSLLSVFIFLTGWYFLNKKKGDN